jgi:hypothetical protein
LVKTRAFSSRAKEAVLSSVLKVIVSPSADTAIPSGVCRVDDREANSFQPPSLAVYCLITATFTIE